MHDFVCRFAEDQLTESRLLEVEEIFKCTRCGYCCQGESTVSLDINDQKRMTEELALPRDKIREQYWRITGSVVQMQIFDGHCIFYDEDNGCTVHYGRPWRCGQWPLHPSILDDENNFITIKHSCPGINKELSYQEFQEKLRALLKLEKKIIC